MHKIFTTETLGTGHTSNTPSPNEPFIVALTSAELYQFKVLDQDAGKMEGLSKVKIAEDYQTAYLNESSAA
ncbi:hypothetical protein BGZ95_008800 [Linnemannia exigua]|uniref:Uncharacterized protein n=1 Tax=Linnemannia exigua TaxID=604196 RepID=A0AAD4DFU9_9FUNG|nr:hypothetical protein BGZ95_008800 [Linnemannia exigua]